MSRIVGWVSGSNRRWMQNPGCEEGLLAGMLRAATEGDGWTAASARRGRAEFGWTGWRTPAIACRGGHLCAVVDGCFYNGSSLEPAANDAERLVALYESVGFVEALRRIRGDFAVALYDARNQSVWLGRDRFGVKPLYYAVARGDLAFGSRPRSVLLLPGLDTGVSRDFVARFAGSHYRTFDNDREASPFTDVRQLPAASALCWREGQLQRTCYWQLEDLPDWDDPDETLAERYRDLLLDAVRIRLAAAHRPAFTLSGGMDSSSVLASAVHVSRQKQPAISTVYTDKTYDESDEIRTILDPTVARWHTVSLDRPDVFGCVERMIEVHDEPVATATWLSHFQLCERAAEAGFGSLFGGLGGDELNAGEYEYFYFHFADLKRARQDRELAHEIACWVRYHDHPVFRKSSDLVARELTRIVDLGVPGRCLPDRRRIGRYAAAVNRDYFDVAGYAPVMDHVFASYLKNRTYQDLFRETAPCCLRAEDRQATACRLDNFLPFFDHQLVEFMFRVPGRLKIRDGITKRLLRDATAGILPDATRTRIKKTGWNAPAHIWFSGRGAEPLRDLIRSQAFRQRGIYNVAEVERLLAEHEEIVTTGKVAENHMMFFWQLVNLELWLQAVPAIGRRAAGARRAA